MRVYADRHASYDRFLQEPGLCVISSIQFDVTLKIP